MNILTFGGMMRIILNCGKDGWQKQVSLLPDIAEIISNDEDDGKQIVEYVSSYKKNRSYLTNNGSSLPDHWIDPLKNEEDEKILARFETGFILKKGKYNSSTLLIEFKDLIDKTKEELFDILEYSNYNYGLIDFELLINLIESKKVERLLSYCLLYTVKYLENYKPDIDDDLSHAQKVLASKRTNDERRKVQNEDEKHNTSEQKNSEKPKTERIFKSYYDINNETFISNTHQSIRNDKKTYIIKNNTKNYYSNSKEQISDAVHEALQRFKNENDDEEHNKKISRSEQIFEYTAQTIERLNAIKQKNRKKIQVFKFLSSKVFLLIIVVLLGFSFFSFINNQDDLNQIYSTAKVANYDENYDIALKDSTFTRATNEEKKKITEYLKTDNNIIFIGPSRTKDKSSLTDVLLIFVNPNNLKKGSLRIIEMDSLGQIELNPSKQKNVTLNFDVSEVVAFSGDDSLYFRNRQFISGDNKKHLDLLDVNENNIIYLSDKGNNLETEIISTSKDRNTSGVFYSLNRNSSGEKYSIISKEVIKIIDFNTIQSKED